jgi:hypothetical protein
MRHISTGVFLSVELATLQGCTTEKSQSSSQKTLAIITGNELYARNFSGYKALKKGLPVDFMHTERSRDPQKLPFALQIDAASCQNGCITYLTILVPFFVPSPAPKFLNPLLITNVSRLPNIMFENPMEPQLDWVFRRETTWRVAAFLALS